MGRLIFGSAEERGRAQNRIAALIIAGILIIAVPGILKPYLTHGIENIENMPNAGEGAGQLRGVIDMIISGMQWIGIALLAIGFIYTGMILRVAKREERKYFR